MYLARATILLTLLFVPLAVPACTLPDKLCIGDCPEDTDPAGTTGTTGDPGGQSETGGDVPTTSDTVDEIEPGGISSTSTATPTGDDDTTDGLHACDIPDTLPRHRDRRLQRRRSRRHRRRPR